jgi:hypothetical protein
MAPGGTAACGSRISNGDGLKGGVGLSHRLNEKRFQEWLAAAGREFRARGDAVVSVSNDLGEIDRRWWWKEGTVREAVSVFVSAAQAMPERTGWNLVVTAPLKQPQTPNVFPLGVNDFVVDDLYPLYFQLNSARYYMTPDWLGLLEHSYTWVDDPWGLTDDRTRVSFARWELRNDLGEYVQWPEYRLRFTRYASSGGDGVSVWARD